MSNQNKGTEHNCLVGLASASATVAEHKAWIPFSVRVNCNWDFLLRYSQLSRVCETVIREMGLEDIHIKPHQNPTDCLNSEIRL